LPTVVNSAFPVCTRFVHTGEGTGGVVRTIDDGSAGSTSAGNANTETYRASMEGGELMGVAARCGAVRANAEGDRSWPEPNLPRQDSNLDKENQNLLCYRYTTG